MKISAGKADGFIQSPPAEITCILLYGPDQGLVSERAKKLGKTILEDLNDPFNSITLQALDLKEDPARLADEAGAISLGGGRRFIRVQDGADSVSAVFKGFLENPFGDALIVVEGGDLSPRSSLRKLFEGDKLTACAIPCYGDEGRNLSDVIQETLNAHGLRADRDAMGYLLAHLGSDRQVSRAELEKLCLYMGDETQVRLEHAMACVGDSAAFSLDKVIYATASGDHKALETALIRCFDEGVQPIMLLRALGRHFHRLHLVKGLCDKGENIDQAMRKLKPPVIFKQVPAFKAQVSMWSLSRLGPALQIITKTEKDCKVTGNPVETLTSRALMRIAQASRQRN